MFKFIGNILKKGASSFKEAFFSTKQKLSESFARIFAYKDKELEEKIIEFLVESDFGYSVAIKIADEITNNIRIGKISNSQESIKESISKEILKILNRSDANSSFMEKKNMILYLVGANGVGKTSLAGKIAKALKLQYGHKVLVIGADKFRYAAKEQLTIWAERGEATMFIDEEKTYPSAEIFSGINFAVDNCYDYVIVDIAGRLETNEPLVKELKKSVMIADKFKNFEKYVLQVIDACSGQASVFQCKGTLEHLKINGLAVTKVDGSSRGGSIVAVSQECGINIDIISTGENIEDIEIFDCKKFVDSII